MSMTTSPMTEIIPSGPGAMYLDEDQGWVPADVSLHFEIVGEEPFTDTIAVLKLEADEARGGTDQRKIAISIELTEGDLVNLMNDAIHEAHNQYMLKDRD